jgi:hypothetical protein
MSSIWKRDRFSSTAEDSLDPTPLRLERTSSPVGARTRAARVASRAGASADASAATPRDSRAVTSAPKSDSKGQIA